MRSSRRSGNNGSNGKSGLSSLSPLSYTRAAMAVGTVLLLFVAISARLIPERVALEAGEEADRTIIASRSVTYTDTQATEERRQRARESVPDQYTVVAEADDLVQQTIDDIFRAAFAVRERFEAAPPSDDETAPLADDTPGAAPADQEPDVDAMIEALQARVELALEEQTLRLLVTAPEGTLERIRSDATTLANQRMQRTIRDNTDDLPEARAAAHEAARNLELTPQYQQMVADIAAKSLRPNQRYDEQRTIAQRNAAASAIEPVTRQIQAGEIVVAAGEEITQRHIDIARALGLMAPTVDYAQALALLVLLMGIVLTFGAYLHRHAREVYEDNRQMLLLCGALVLAAAGFRVALQWSVYGAIALGISTLLAMIVAMLLGTRIAIMSSLSMGLLVGLVATGSDVRLVITTILASIFAAFAVSSTGNRGVTIARSAGLVGIGNAIIFIVASEVFGLSLSVTQIIAAAVVGLIAASLAVVAVVALERVVGVVTDLRLLELSNPNEPVLHRLLTEAPGSYQSAVMVGNLAEPAAEEIGANPLLVRAIALYHDIGKLKRPYFFIENQFGEENPHEKLKPHLSALTLMAHARDGYEMAKEIGLPREISDAIRQHHGTSLASYPYHLAVQQEGEENVKESDYRYPGPKPQTKEAALLMLADSVEAAARTLVDPTRDQIEELVDRIIESKVDDGQLNESPLTFDDLRTIRDSFISTLHGMFHQRLKYPDQDEAEEEAAVASSLEQIERSSAAR